MAYFPTPGQLRFGIPKGVIDSLPAIGSVAGSIIDARSNAATNRASAQQAREARDFEAQQSATQLQRAKADAIAAGYNPGLMYQQGGNSDASASAAPVIPKTSGTAEKLAAMVGVYNQLATSTAQRQQIRAQTDNLNADTASKQIQNNNPDYALWFGNGTGVAEYRQARQQLRLSEVQRGIQENQNYPTQFRANLKNLNANTAASAAQAQLMGTQSTLNEQNFTNEWFRKKVAPYINSSAQTIGLVSDFIPKIVYRK